MKKKWIVLTALLLAVCLLAACAEQSVPAAEMDVDNDKPAAAAEEPAVGLANPMVSCASYAELTANVPGIKLSDAPLGAENAVYDYIKGEPVVAQIIFSYAGDEYTYRAAQCVNEAAMVDISGVYEEFPHVEELDNEQNITDGGKYTLRYRDDNDIGLATWYYPPTGCQYSLFTETGCNEHQMIEEVIDLMLPIHAALPPEGALPVEKPAQAGEVGGMLVELNDNDIVVNLEDGSTLVFLLTYMDNVEATPGDQVNVAYAGSLTESPEALSVTVIKAATAPLTVSGTVTAFDEHGVFVQTATGNVFGFITDDAKFTGASQSLKIGNTVTVTYEGDLTNLPKAKQIETETVAADPASEDEHLKNKTLKGTISKLSTKNFTLRASNGNSYVFKKSGDTAISGKYELQKGASVKVTYDGYASQNPLAKAIKVLAPPDPTPPKPTPTTAPAKSHTVSGVITMHAGNALSIVTNSGRTYSFLLGAPVISGNSYGYVGDYASVTYYTSNGSNVVTSVVYTSGYTPPPVPAPTAWPVPTAIPAPTLPPDPCTTRTVSGVIIMSAGNALTISTNSGGDYSFLLGAPRISGDSGCGEGDIATVTFTDCGGRYNVLSVNFRKVRPDPPIVLGPGPVIDGSDSPLIMADPVIGEGATPVVDGSDSPVIAAPAA